MNSIKTAMFLAALTALLLALGLLLGGKVGLVMALMFAVIMNFGAYWFSDRIVLSMYHAQQIGPNDEPELFNIVQGLASRANIPMPKLFIISEDTPNAFATGRNPQHASVAVTEGLLKMLSREELAGVIAHELSHVNNRDTLIMTIAATMAGALSMIANMAGWGMMMGGHRSDDDDDVNPLAALLGIILAPIAAALIQMAISRSREFEADETGARLTNNPLALASALRKIESWSQKIPIHEGSPATAHLFIINPFSGRGLSNLFSTHPSTEARVERLHDLAAEISGNAYAKISR